MAIFLIGRLIYQLFQPEFAAFCRDLKTDGSLYRHLHVPRDLETERRVTELLRPHLPLPAERLFHVDGTPRERFVPQPRQSGTMSAADSFGTR